MAKLLAYARKFSAEPLFVNVLNQQEVCAYGYVITNETEDWNVRKSTTDRYNYVNTIAGYPADGNIGVVYLNDSYVPAQDLHPIVSGRNGDVIVAQIGEIDNVNTLRGILESAGYEPNTNTTAEVIGNLFDFSIRRHPVQSPFQHELAAYIWTIAQQLDGAYTFALSSKAFPQLVAITTNGMSLFVSPNGYAVSDLALLKGLADRYYQLASDEVAVGDSLGFQIIDCSSDSFTIPLWQKLGV